MSLAPGFRLGRYVVVDALGAGGMGEVYRARDSQLNRVVAVKVIRDASAHDAGYLKRFEREARAVAALNHPNICTVHDVGQQDGFPYLVMELLEGRTLESRLKSGRLLIAEACLIGKQVCDALACAHRSGILHRDIKPANIILTRSGAKLMDFGLAKVRPEPREPEQTALTAEGVQFGTFEYMSPERLHGQTADEPSDLWAVGVVLHEMASGRHPFQRASKASFMAAILQDSPTAFEVLPEPVPPRLERLIVSCLEKDPEARWQSAADLSRELGWVMDTVTPQPAAKPRLVSARQLAFGSVLIPVLVAGGLYLGSRLATPSNGRAVRHLRTSIAFPGMSDPLVPPGGYAISPDGSAIAVTALDSTGAGRLFVRQVGDDLPRLFGDESGANIPFWSPDSRGIAYATDDGKLVRIHRTGGAIETICDSADYAGGAWGKDDWIIYSTNRGSIKRVRASGGRPEVVVPVDPNKGPTVLSQPMMLPDGTHFLYALSRGYGRTFEVRVGSVGGGPTRFLLFAENVPRCSPDGWLVYLRNRTVFAQRIDSKGSKLLSEPYPLPESPTRQTYYTIFGPGPVLGLHAMAYALDDPRQREIRWLDRDGRAGAPVGTVPGPFVGAAASPDGEHMALTYAQGMETNIWLLDLRSGSLSRLTDPNRIARRPVWLDGGRTLLFEYFSDAVGSLCVVNIDNPDSVTTLVTAPPGEFLDVLSVLDRGRIILAKIGWGTSLVFATADSAYRLSSYVSGGRGALDAKLMQNGQWIILATNDKGRFSLFADTFPVPGHRTRLTREAIGPSRGYQSFWMAKDNEILYLSADGKQLRSMPLEITRKGIRAGEARTLFMLSDELRDISISPDGARFLAVSPAGFPQVPSLTFIQDWETEIRK